MYEVLGIYLSCIATLYSGRPLLVAVVASFVIQFFTNRIPSESALYIISAVCSMEFPTRVENQSIIRMDMLAILVVGEILIAFQMNEIISIILLESLAVIMFQMTENLFQRISFILVCLASKFIWYHDVTFYTCMSMMVFLGFVIMSKKQKK
jgi:hypothetical protein